MEDYAYCENRYESRYLLFTLLTHNTKVKTRSLVCPSSSSSSSSSSACESKNKSKKGVKRTVGDDLLVDALSEEQADVRVIQIHCSSVAEARSRAALLFLSTYDARSGSGVEALGARHIAKILEQRSGEVMVEKKRMVSQQDEVSEGKMMNMNNMNRGGSTSKLGFSTARSGTTKRNSSGYFHTDANSTNSNNRNNKEESKVEGEGEGKGKGKELLSINKVIAPIEAHFHFQTPLPQWILKRKVDKWDCARFRFMLHSLVVCSSAGYLIDVRVSGV